MKERIIKLMNEYQVKEHEIAKLLGVKKETLRLKMEHNNFSTLEEERFNLNYGKVV